MEGFFQESTKPVKQELPLIPKCGACGLYKKCLSPKMPPTGSGKRKILIVGEAPGEEEDRKNKQFIGKSGRFLRDALENLGIAPNRDCWFTNALICRPPDNVVETQRQIDYCRPNLIKTVQEFGPEVIIPLGASAVKSVIQWAWEDEPLPLNRWIGQTIPSITLNAWICPTWHPAYLLRANDRVTDRIWRDNLRTALEKKLRPYKKGAVPHIKQRLTLCVDDSVVDSLIDSLVQGKRRISFDYETNMLKPDSQEARIICCSISDGDIALSFPWTKNSSRAMKRVLHNPEIAKIGYNIKFEERWTIREFGSGVRNWAWDGMLGAHTLDNRPGTKSLNFQMFVRLGIPIYDSHIKPFLHSDDSNSINRIKQIPMMDLLEYNATDALVEFWVAQQQWRVFNGSEHQ